MTLVTHSTTQPTSSQQQYLYKYGAQHIFPSPNHGSPLKFELWTKFQHVLRWTIPCYQSVDGIELRRSVGVGVRPVCGSRGEPVLCAEKGWRGVAPLFEHRPPAKIGSGFYCRGGGGLDLSSHDHSPMSVSNSFPPPPAQPFPSPPLSPSSNPKPINCDHPLKIWRLNLGRRSATGLNPISRNALFDSNLKNSLNHVLFWNE